MQTMQNFIDRHNITMEAQRVPENPNIVADEKWSREAGHFFCTLFLKEDPHFHPANPREALPCLSIYYSMGSGLKRRGVFPSPKAEEVLNCLAMDAQSIKNTDSFEDWACELGFDADSRKDEEVYKGSLREAKKLKAFLGPEAYRELLFETESL